MDNFVRIRTEWKDGKGYTDVYYGHNTKELQDIINMLHTQGYRHVDGSLVGSLDSKIKLIFADSKKTIMYTYDLYYDNKPIWYNKLMRKYKYKKLQL